ncbi:hypothetical protein FIU95_04975 [Microbulbifer sp. THAF38]|nr:hypothetical protein FIU95_04975 [Microbulbifer sp. THAF38]
MNEILKEAYSEFLSELKKDLPFFSLSGALVGIFMIIYAPARRAGIASEESWANALFSDFVSFQAYGLMLFGVLILGSAAVCISRLEFRCNIFHDSAAHLKLRLKQVTSSIVAFTLGLSIVSIIHSAFNWSVHGTALALLMICFNSMLITGLFSSEIALYLIETSKKKSAPFLALFASILPIVGLLLWGGS